MKLERLLSIIVILINRRIVQAKELAERFEVSVRTIYRDIDALNKAGIPVVTYQGSGGGIGLAASFPNRYPKYSRLKQANCSLTSLRGEIEIRSMTN
ncbi:helix-turn-helix transcriptional regulator [Paenibacillus sp. GCM10012307]|uniref:helix-turn-helix transcriptional regulator n=1 Tax=Paenibacillus TaxID=44249 RepID=UPI001E374434|nr:HTH domain-containing protein [Paenibacillus roseus]